MSKEKNECSSRTEQSVIEGKKNNFEEGIKSKIDLVNAEVYLSDSKIQLHFSCNFQAIQLSSQFLEQPP